MKRTVGLAVLIGICGLFLMAGGVFAADLEIGCAIYKFDDTFMTGVRNAIAEAAKGKAKVDIVDSQNSQSTQNDRVDMFITKRMNALAINPVDRTAAGVIIDKAKAENIPVVFFNREPLPEDMQKWDKVYYVGARAEESGTMSGQIIVDFWKSHPEADKNGDGVLQYVMLKGEPGHQDAIIRTENSVNTLLESGVELEKLSYQIANWNRAQAQAKMSQLISQFGSRIELVLCNNDDMALGAIDAYDRANITESDRPAVFGTDGTKVGLQAILDGTMRGTVYNDKEGQALMMAKLAVALHDGSDLSLFPFQDGVYIYLPYQKLTADNVVEFLEK